MTNLDDDRLELLERQLAERVTARVRPALFRLYASVGAAVIGALGFVSWDIVDDIKAEVKGEILGSIDKDIAAKRSEIAERVTEARIMAQRASQVIQRVEKQLDDFQPQAENLDATIEKVESLNVTSKDLVALYSRELQPLIANVESLSSQLTLLAQQVEQLNSIAAADEPDTADQPTKQMARLELSGLIQSVISDTKKAEQRLEQARSKPTVFFQFAGGRRDQAEALSAALTDEGYVVPGIDREIGATGRREIRYFHEEDLAAAERLAQDTTSALGILYPDRTVPDIAVKSFLSYGGKKPRPGVIELWLALPAK